MRLRKKNITTIQYILVADGSPITIPILIPDAFDNSVISFIKECPLDILQLINPINFFEEYHKNNWNYGYYFQVFNIEDYEIVKDGIDQTNNIQLFFLNGESEKHINLYSQLRKNDNKTRYFHFYNTVKQPFEENTITTSPTHFINSIINNQVDILEYLQLSDLKIAPSIPIEFKEYSDHNIFIPAKHNCLLIDKITGNFGGYYSSQLNKNLAVTSKEESVKAHKNAHSFDRQNLFVKQLSNIDFFINFSYENKIMKLVSGIEPYLSPLILVSPFHNPDLKKSLPSKEFSRILQGEQTENYIHVGESRLSEELMFAGVKLQANRIKYLDDVSFLHSSLTFSPVIRLPIKGKSIYRELSFFRPEFFPNISLKNNRQKLKKTIKSFGKIFKELAISPEIEKSIKERNGQIVAISDLPIEWTLIDGIPLTFTHDVCRLPETSLHGLMGLYMQNQSFEYSIPIDIIQKTLVIIGTQEKSFAKWHQYVYEMAKETKFKIVVCKNLEDVRKAVISIKPEFLIFDCHGGYDPITHSTFLNIGDEKLDGDYVVKNEIYAPLVFLSACGTAPTYGTMNPIANAFFEAGAISVTSTFLPIDINAGSILYIRILNKLNFVASRVIHKNWLEFVCHVIRTSSIHEAYMLARKSHDIINEDKFVNSNINAIEESLHFSNRRELFNSMDNKLTKLTRKQRLYYSDVIPEYLFYCNLGRSDLILFDKWNEKNIEENVD